ncbi:unnamed protein product [Ectocarpus sp. 4 AP-2014]
MNDHVDTMNGAYGRNKVKVKKRIDIVKSCITSADSVHLVRILAILDCSMTGGVTLSFSLTGRIASKARFSREGLGSTCWYRFWVCLNVSPYRRGPVACARGQPSTKHLPSRS